jgi:predicted hotdog family 3-hydroxylacyl-ACP dehydratase
VTFPPIAELLPHKPPMLLLDAVTCFEEDAAECTVAIRESSTFFEREGVPAWVAMEYCAQCIAAFAGLRARQSGGEPRMGLLVAARELTLHTDWFRAGETLLVRAQREFGEERVGRFDCRVTRDGIVVATASLSVYLPGGGSPAELAPSL